MAFVEIFGGGGFNPLHMHNS